MYIYIYIYIHVYIYIYTCIYMYNYYIIIEGKKSYCQDILRKKTSHRLRKHS